MPSSGDSHSSRQMGACHRSAVFRHLHRRESAVTETSGDGQSVARHIASVGRVGLAAGAAVLGAAVFAPGPAQATTGDFCNADGTAVTLDNPFTNGAPWTCIRWQQQYTGVSYVSGEWDIFASDGGCEGLTSSGQGADPRHTSDMTHVHGRYTCNGLCETQCAGSSGHPWVKDATASGGPLTAEYYGKIAY